MPIATHYKLRKITLLDGTCPFDIWFERLEAEDQFMVENRLIRVRLGNFGEVNEVGNGVWELKFRKGSAFRVYYALVGREVVLLIVGGNKRTQRRDVEKAKKLFCGV